MADNDNHRETIAAKQHELSTALGVTMKVRISTLKQYGIYEAYLALRPNAATLADDECDHIYILQARMLGLIP